MRTTVTLEPDTEALLREEMARTGASFKDLLNQSIRRSLIRQYSNAGAATVIPLFPAAFPSEFEGRSLNRLADELDDEVTLRELGA